MINDGRQPSIIMECDVLPVVARAAHVHLMSNARGPRRDGVGGRGGEDVCKNSSRVV